MKILYSFCLFLLVSHLAQAQLNVSYVGNITYNNDLSDIWGYVAPDGTEYAIVGIENGISVVSLADPTNPVEVDFVPGISTIWRDIKTWGNYAYVINEGGNGLAVLNLETLPDSVSATNWTPTLAGLGTLSTCHNIYIDEFGFAYIAGCNLNNGGVLVLDVHTTPGTPIHVGTFPSEYSHDLFVRGNKAYSAEIYLGEFSIYDVTDKANIQYLGGSPTGGAFTHNTWLSNDNNFVFTTDEVNNGPIGSYDVTDPADIKELDQFRPYATLGEGVIPHNVHVFNDYLIISYYTDGCIIVDAARKDNLVEVGNFDTYIPTSTGFNGAWGAYPFLPSGLILVSDIGNGMYVLAPNYLRACYLEGKITDAVTGATLSATSVKITGTDIEELSRINGTYGTGIATAGDYAVTYSKAGYLPQTIDVTLTNGNVLIKDVSLTPLPNFAFSVSVFDATNNVDLSDAIIRIYNDDFSFDITTDVNGIGRIPAMYEGDYTIAVGKWGFKTKYIENQIISTSTPLLVFNLEEGIEDIFELDLGWTISGNSFQGQFELGVPVLATIDINGPVEVQPGMDSNDDGQSCYVTGNISDVNGGVFINGTTKITSPPFDMTDMNDPFISFATWYLNVDGNSFPFTLGNDRILVKLSNGVQTKNIALIRDEDAADVQQWKDFEYHLTDTNFVLNANMRLSFEINDSDFNDVSEGLVDNVKVWDANPTSSIQEPLLTASYKVFPNPVLSGQFFVQLTTALSGNTPTLQIINAIGQTVHTQSIAKQQMLVEVSASLSPGLYQIVLKDDIGTYAAKTVVVQ